MLLNRRHTVLNSLLLKNTEQQKKKIVDAVRSHIKACKAAALIAFEP